MYCKKSCKNFFNTQSPKHLLIKKIDLNKKQTENTKKRSLLLSVVTIFYFALLFTPILGLQREEKQISLLSGNNEVIIAKAKKILFLTLFFFPLLGSYRVAQKTLELLFICILGGKKYRYFRPSLPPGVLLFLQI